MIWRVLFFLFINFIIITVKITMGRLIFLFLLTVTILKAYKWKYQKHPNDKLVIEPLPNQMQSLLCIQLILGFMDLLFKPQSYKTYLVMALSLTGFLLLSSMFSFQTIFITLLNTELFMELYS